MIKISIIFSILGAILYFGGSIIEKIQRKKNQKKDNE